jgi:hypothetical protein
MDEEIQSTQEVNSQLCDGFSQPTVEGHNDQHQPLKRGRLLSLNPRVCVFFHLSRS